LRENTFLKVNRIQKCFYTGTKIDELLLLDKTLKYLTKVFEILNPQGLVIISTPNVDHINQLWKQDVTHIQQYPGKDVFAILRMIGVTGNIEVFRINLCSPKFSFKKFMVEKARIVLNKVLVIDYAHGLLIIAFKNAE
jgi:predicted SAM-dependent methyltransferase